MTEEELKLLREIQATLTEIRREGEARYNRALEMTKAQGGPRWMQAVTANPWFGIMLAFVLGTVLGACF